MPTGPSRRSTVHFINAWPSKKTVVKFSAVMREASAGACVPNSFARVLKESVPTDVGAGLAAAMKGVPRAPKVHKPAVASVVPKHRNRKQP